MIELALMAAAGFAWWRVSLRFHPYAPCRRCEGGGKNAGSSRQRYGWCRRCKGSGRRERVGLHWFSRN